MKKYVLCLAAGTLMSMQQNNCMARRILAHLKPLQLHRMTPLVARRIHAFTTPQWPDYTREQADLITDITIKNNHLNSTDAYDRNLKIKIEAAAATLCPDHRPSRCSTCWLPQKKAFFEVSAAISQNHIHSR